MKNSVISIAMIIFITFVSVPLIFSQDKTLSERSPFGFNSPRVPDRMPPDWMMSLPPGYDRPEDVVNTGARWARYAGLEGLTWELIEREKGEYDWSRTDYMFSEANKAGLNLVVVILSWNHLDQPDAKISPGAVSAKMPYDIAWFLKFLEKAVERYDGDGIDDAPGSPVVNYWEVENEVDFDIFWADSPENYARLLKESYKVIKKANPNAKVLIAGMSHQPTLEKSRNYYFSILEALDRIKDNPDDKYFDIFNLHLYNFDKDISVIPTLDTHVRAIRNELLKYGYNVPFWMTETGDYSGSPIAPSGVNLLAKTESEQAENLFKIYVYSFAHNIKKVFWVTLTEWSGFGGIKNGVWDNIGLINNPNTDGQSQKKLAYFTYQKMAEVLEGSDWDNVQPMQEEDGVYIYRFLKYGKPIYVAWNDSAQEKQVYIPGITLGKIRITEAIPKSAYGTAFKTETNTLTDDKMDITLGNIPVFIEED